MFFNEYVYNELSLKMNSLIKHFRAFGTIVQINLLFRLEQMFVKREEFAY